MMGQKGASLESTRNIYRRMYRDLLDARERLAAMQARPNYRADNLVVALVASLERSVSGATFLVGVLPKVWAAVCDQYRETPPKLKPKRAKVI